MQIDATEGNPGVHPARTAMSGATEDASLRVVAKDLEAAFLAEMLKHSSLGTPSGTFGGGAGETQFVSFLTQEHARLMTERGGIGLAENIYRALVARGAP